MKLEETVQTLLKEHGPAAILDALSAECLQNAEYEADNDNKKAKELWIKVYRAINDAWLKTPSRL